MTLPAARNAFMAYRGLAYSLFNGPDEVSSGYHLLLWEFAHERRENSEMPFTLRGSFL